jgi:hypothetical protein
MAALPLNIGLIIGLVFGGPVQLNCRCSTRTSPGAEMSAKDARETNLRRVLGACDEIIPSSGRTFSP